ncbi:MAG: hypothetical protein ACOY94_07350 [Bacillota bacterium]
MAERAQSKASKAPVVPSDVSNDVAASSISIPVQTLISELDTFKSLQQAPKGELLKGNRQPARIRMSSPAYGRTNAEANDLFILAVADHKLQSPRFEALRIQFSDTLQAALCVPVSEYDATQPDMLKVTWSPDGTEMRCDFAYALLPKQWGVPRKMYRQVPIGLVRDLPKIGTAIVMDLRGSWLEAKKESAKKEGANKESAKNEGGEVQNPAS